MSKLLMYNWYKLHNIAATIFFIFSVASSSIAAVDNVFYVENIHVFYDAGNLKDSKKIAIEDGIMSGLKKLSLAITMPAAHKRIDNLKVTDFKKLIKKIQFLDERMTSHSYMATLNIEFDEKNVLSLLNSSGILYQTKIFDSFVIIPFLKNSMNWLWFNGNWKESWDRIPEQIGMIRPAVIRGNIQDIDNIDLSSFMTAEYVSFSNILERYRVRELVLIEASQYGSSMELVLRILSNKNDLKQSLSYEQQLGETEFDWYTRIAMDIMNIIDSRWKGDMGSLK